MPKAGPGLDLPLACAVLAASGQLPAERLGEVALAGELGLDGSLRPARGTLAIAQAARAAGLGVLVLAPGRAREAGLIEHLEVSAADSLASAVRILCGGRPDEPLPDEDGGAPLPAGERRPARTCSTCAVSVWLCGRS